MPSDTYNGARHAPGLSVRGLRLNITQSDTERLYPNPRVVDRVKDYWGAGYKDDARFRCGTTWYQYPDFYASFDCKGVCGAIIGNGLERDYVPILRSGDSGPDVERLLGKPSAFEHTRYVRGDATEWRYNFTDDSGLTVYFVDGRVEKFEWRQSDFSDSGC